MAINYIIKITDCYRCNKDIFSLADMNGYREIYCNDCWDGLSDDDKQYADLPPDEDDFF